MQAWIGPETVTDTLPGGRVARWRLLPRVKGLRVIMLAVAAGDHVRLSGSLRGEWGTGQRGGSWLVGVRVFGPAAAAERLLFTDDVDRALLEAILDVPHLVVIAPTLGDPIVVEVTARSSHVARLLSRHICNF
jgi:hypothetical protein